MPRGLIAVLLTALPVVAADPKPLAAFDAALSFTDGGGFSDDGKQVIGVGGGTVRRVDLDTGKELPLPSALKGERIDCGIRVQDDVWFLSIRCPTVLSERDGHASRFLLFDFATEQVTADWTGHADTVGAITHLSATDQLVTAGTFSDHAVRFWDRKTQKPLGGFDPVKELDLTPKDEKDSVDLRRMTADPSGKLLAFGFDTGLIQVRELKTEKWHSVQADLRGVKDEDFKGRVQGLTFLDEKRLAVKWMRVQFRRPKLTTTDAVEVFDWRAGKVLFRIEGKGHLSDPTGTPDGKWLVVGADDGVVRVWDVANGKEVNRFPVDPKRVSGVAFTRDNKRLITVGSEGVKVWDAEGVTKPAKR